MLAGAVLGQRRLVVGDLDDEVDAGLRHGVLQRGRQFARLGLVGHVHGDVEAVRIAGLGQQLLGLGDIEA